MSLPLKSSKNHIKVLKLKKFMVRQWSLPYYFASKTKKFRCVVIFLSRMQWKILAGKCDRYRVGWKRSTRLLVEDGMSTGLTNTHTVRGFSDLYHVFARKQCILCPALRHGCLTLLYVTSLRDFFCPWNNRAQLYYAADSQPRVFARLRGGNN